MQENLQTVRLTRQYLGSGVVGLDLAGAEGIVPLENFHPIFDLARELSLPFTCHAGDSQGPETVRACLLYTSRPLRRVPGLPEGAGRDPPGRDHR